MENLEFLSLQHNVIREITGLKYLQNLKNIFLYGNPVYDWVIENYGKKYKTNAQVLIDYCKQHERELREKNEIPDYENLIRSYVYSQMVDLQKEFKNIDIETLDNMVKTRLNTKIDLFVKYLKMEGYPLTQYQIELLKEDCFIVSEPIRNELRLLIQREEKERIIREKAEMTKELFGKEMIKREDIEKVEKYRTIDEEIDELLKSYEDWEYSGEGKK